MKASDLSGFFLRSLFISASLNFTRMQNLGFAYALLPLARFRENEKQRQVAFLLRHLDYFNTHPYLAGAVLGAVIRIEEDERTDDAAKGTDVTRLKKSLMGPYAAIGDNFFSGSLRPLAAIVAAIMAWGGFIWAPLIFLLIFTPLQFWIRVRGFMEGYRRDWQGFIYIQSWDLPRFAGYLRRVSLALLAVATVIAGEGIYRFTAQNWPRPGLAVALLAAVLLSYYAVRRGLSPLIVLYGMMAVCLIVMV